MAPHGNIFDTPEPMRPHGHSRRGPEGEEYEGGRDHHRASDESATGNIEIPPKVIERWIAKLKWPVLFLLFGGTGGIGTWMGTTYVQQARTAENTGVTAAAASGDLDEVKREQERLWRRIEPIDAGRIAEIERRLGGLESGQAKVVASLDAAAATSEDIKDSMATLTREIRAMRREAAAEQPRGNPPR